MNYVLVDASTWDETKDGLIAKIEAADIIGFDIETCDPDRHQGLTDFMKANSKRLVFDVNRTIVTGFSLYVDEDDTAYYVNLNHADVERRLPWAKAKLLLWAKKPEAYWICHNAPFELTMMSKSLDFELGNVICTLQMAVSTFNEDQAPIDAHVSAGFGGMSSLLLPIARAFTFVEGRDLNEDQSKLASQILGKQSKAQHSYNGYVKNLSYGYGLKSLTKKLFGYDQTTFAEVLNGREHMGQLTGAEVLEYGADDAVWTVKIFHKLLPMMMAQNDKLLNTFLEQENPMIHVFADIWKNGLRINLEQVRARREVEIQNYAMAVRKLHAVVGGMLPFPEEPNEWLLMDAWYAKNPTGYRNKLSRWATTPLPQDDLGVIQTTSGPVAGKTAGPNLSYYMSVRTLIYDLPGLKPRYSEGKISSDDEARQKMRGKGIDPLIDCLDELAGIEQRMKLYLNPYLQLIDPETSRVYPVVSSRLNSRRMGMENPNGMQLAKRGEAKYIRGFYEADEPDHVLVSIDWSQVELVEIGDFSGDPEFANAFGQLPYKDLHKKAVMDLMDLAIHEVTKDLRTKVGKGANFNYWYSGALSTVGEQLGWSPEKMWEMTDRYRQTFAVAEQWRTDLIREGREKGYITLPDGHRRVRFEATYTWQTMWRDRWNAAGNQGMINFGQIFVQRITTRAGNQLVNSMIQGSCATLAKRSILRINKELKPRFRFRFLMPIHDELVFSVHRDDAVVFIREAKRIMCDHPDIIKNLVLDASCSMGRTFEPFSVDKAPYGQIELDEAPEILGFTKDSKLTDAEIGRVIEYLFDDQLKSQRKAA